MLEYYETVLKLEDELETQTANRSGEHASPLSSQDRHFHVYSCLVYAILCLRLHALPEQHTSLWKFLKAPCRLKCLGKACNELLFGCLRYSDMEAAW
jgi:hypothetical protein